MRTHKKPPFLGVLWMSLFFLGIIIAIVMSMTEHISNFDIPNIVIGIFACFYFGTIIIGVSRSVKDDYRYSKMDPKEVEKEIEDKALRYRRKIEEEVKRKK